MIYAGGHGDVLYTALTTMKVYQDFILTLVLGSSIIMAICFPDIADDQMAGMFEVYF
ncbi:hypothetical protein QTV49_003934 [Vibrio vulnificus]|nr:hypothetical protein [Vibrio vulnificus]